MGEQIDGHPPRTADGLARRRRETDAEREAALNAAVEKDRRGGAFPGSPANPISVTSGAEGVGDERGD